MAMDTATVDLPAQITLDQAIVALLRLRRRDVPGDATLDQPAILQIAYVQQLAAEGGLGTNLLQAAAATSPSRRR